MLSPLTPELFMADLARGLGGLPLLIVVRGSLGTINHTLLTLNYARRERFEVLGVVMSHASQDHGLAASLNADALRRWADALLLGEIPFLSHRDDDSIKAAVKSNLNLEPIQRWLKE
jgi:dethiobiotin synthetase